MFRSLFPTGSADQLELKHTLMHWLANAYETSINQLALTVLYLSSVPVEHDAEVADFPDLATTMQVIGCS